MSMWRDFIRLSSRNHNSVAYSLYSRNAASGLFSGIFLPFSGYPAFEDRCAIDHGNVDTDDGAILDRSGNLRCENLSLRGEIVRRRRLAVVSRRRRSLSRRGFCCCRGVFCSFLR